MRRIVVILVAGLLAGGLVAPDADARGKKSSSSKSKRSNKRQSGFSGANAPKDSLRTEPLERPSGNLWVRAENTGEEIKVNIYKPDGSFDDASLGQLDEIWRCLRSGKIRAVRPELYEQMSRMQDHFGGKQIQLVSGFRIERSSSRHFHASAGDFRIKDISIREAYDYAKTLDQGGMGLGIYLRSQFIHVDYRAPGEPSFRWTDYSGPSRGGKAKKSKHKTGRKHPARKPTS
ncbi:MAG: DUF882 domain-containing protein [Kofleriaceae bacterium]